MDLQYVCNYYKALVIPQMPDDFTIAKRFRHGLTDDEIRKGMTAYREFLYAFFDKISKYKDKIDVEKGSKYDPYGSKGNRGTSNTKECFPVFLDVAMILLTLGFHGRLETKPEKKLTIRGQDIFTVICPVTEKYQSLIKMSSERKLEMFHLLSDLGLRFNSLDFFNDVDFTKVETFYVTSDENEFFAVGLKLIAASTVNNKYYIKLENLLHPVILRGDFYPLANATPKKHVIHINEYSNPHTPEIREWVKDIDRLLINNNCTMVRSDGKFQYTKRGKSVTYGLVCIIDLNITGCFITPGINHLESTNNVISMLPDFMVDMLKSGNDCEKFNEEQCHRRSGNMAFARFSFAHNGEEFEGCRHAGLRCQFSGAKCRFTGYRYDLADPSVRELMRTWIELELSVYV